MHCWKSIWLKYIICYYKWQFKPTIEMLFSKHVFSYFVMENFFLIYQVSLNTTKFDPNTCCWKVTECFLKMWNLAQVAISEYKNHFNHQ